MSYRKINKILNFVAISVLSVAAFLFANLPTNHAHAADLPTANDLCAMANFRYTASPVAGGISICFSNDSPLANCHASFMVAVSHGNQFVSNQTINWPDTRIPLASTQIFNDASGGGSYDISGTGIIYDGGVGGRQVNSIILPEQSVMLGNAPSSTGGTITLNVTPSSINLRDASGNKISPTPSFNITYSFDGFTDDELNGDLYNLEISDCDGTYWNKNGSINESGNVTWTPQQTTCGSHTVRIELTDTTKNNAVVATAEQSVSVEGYDPPADPNNPSGSTTSGSTGDDSNAGKITEPQGSVNDTLSDEVKGFFGNDAFKMPTNISGIGGLLWIVVKTLEMLVAVLSFFGVLYGGIQYITSGGDNAKAEKAKKTLLYCVIGLVLAIFSWMLTSVIVNEISKL